MSDYVPKTGSIAERICAFFRDNPDEELTRRDIADKFSCAPSGVDGILLGAVDAGLVAIRNNEEMVRVWVAGAKKATTPPPKVKIPRPRVPLLDPNKVQIRKNEPLPEVRAGGGHGYVTLLQRMAPGDSVELPTRQAYSLYAACKKLTGVRDGQIKFALRKVDESTHGVWRTA